MFMIYNDSYFLIYNDVFVFLLYINECIYICIHLCIIRKQIHRYKLKNMNHYIS